MNKRSSVWKWLAFILFLGFLSIIVATVRLYNDGKTVDQQVPGFDPPGMNTPTPHKLNIKKGKRNGNP